ncbi:hypothetical protein [Anaerophilus nitritogenes]|uniref:hypothetical protein n=1 Tax=Anaerophilus nitritogenes TaxID=2498136 RepID=UPI00101D01E9|nr:hypothetical protein [Anaerophilus nitritogenes]
MPYHDHGGSSLPPKYKNVHIDATKSQILSEMGRLEEIEENMPTITKKLYYFTNDLIAGAGWFAGVGPGIILTGYKYIVESALEDQQRKVEKAVKELKNGSAKGLRYNMTLRYRNAGRNSGYVIDDFDFKVLYSTPSNPGQWVED